MPRPSKSGPLPWLVLAVVLLVLLPAAYMGGYYAMLKGHRIGRIQDDLAERLPEYRSENLALEFVLAPAHEVDRVMRPKHWAWEPIP